MLRIGDIVIENDSILYRKYIIRDFNDNRNQILICTADTGINLGWYPIKWFSIVKELDNPKSEIDYYRWLSERE